MLLLLLLILASSCDKRHIDSNEEAIGKFDILADVMRIQLGLVPDTTYVYNASYTGYIREALSEDSVPSDLIILQYFGPFNDIGEIAARMDKEKILLEQALIPGDSVSGLGTFKGKDLDMDFVYQIADQVQYTVRLIATQDRK